MNSTLFSRSVQFTSPANDENSSPTVPTSGPFRYPVPRTGFYCVGTVPVLVEGTDEESTAYSGVVDFENVFGGRLAAAEYPKIAVSFLCISNVILV